MLDVCVRAPPTLMYGVIVVGLHVCVGVGAGDEPPPPQLVSARHAALTARRTDRKT
jgi:hypothetical protein